ncbi:hypothetical protein L484_023430 [Morus notabilis]|uniref:Uncharacterized protein n=1 Tax=Morus notabilis TaxID=981085 RepID=W9RDB5_9ROSA|nr:hypothetical protein L484_023430 [Morus notabilis]
MNVYIGLDPSIFGAVAPNPGDKTKSNDMLRHSEAVDHGAVYGIGGWLGMQKQRNLTVAIGRWSSGSVVWHQAQARQELAAFARGWITGEGLWSNEA